MHKLFNLIQLSVFVLCFSRQTSAQFNNCSSTEYSIPVTASDWRVVFVFNCDQFTAKNQLFPSTYTAQPTKYNEIDLSPNVFTAVPVTQLCPFKYINTLDLSNNELTDLTNIFKDLSCLTALKTINFANNRIASPILSRDFDDSFSAQLESLNFTNNLIPYLQSSVFIKSDGTTRFPRLSYLGLAKNQLKTLDLLWPMSLPNANLYIDMKINPITTLTNELKLTYNDVSFPYPLINNRKLDATTNSLQYLDDSNMLQYGLYNENDLRDFLFKMSNYDLRQSNLVRTYICYCPPSGQLTVYWFRRISSSIDTTRPIYQLYCSGYEKLVYVFDFDCSFTTPYTGPSTTTYSTLSPFVVPNFTTPSAANQLAGNPTVPAALGAGTTTTTTTAATSSVNNDYFFLFFLFIPFFFILCLIFICCIGRCCQVRTNNWCNLICCPCFRPHDESPYTGKHYDATICYNRFDESWVDEDFIPELTHYENNYKIHKLNIHSRSSDKVTRENERVLRASKRIILIFTPDFIEDDFKNKTFVNLLREIKYDPNVCIIAINKNLDDLAFKHWVRLLNSQVNYNSPNIAPRRSIFTVLKSRIKYNCGLREVETLNFRERSFWRKFFYIMPFTVYDNTKPAIITHSYKDDFKLPKLQTKKERADSVDYIKETKTKNTQQLSYASDYKNSKSLRHVIIPIPDFMRTTLGFNKKNKQPLEEEGTTAGYNSNRTNIFNSIQQQDTNQKNIFSSIPLNAATPVPASARVYNTPAQSSRSNKQEKVNLAMHSSYYENQQKISTIDNQGSLEIKNYLPNHRDLPVINNRIERNHTPDILALFAPQPDTVIQMKKSRSERKREKRSRSSRTDEDYVDRDVVIDKNESGKYKNRDDAFDD